MQLHSKFLWQRNWSRILKVKDSVHLKIFWYLLWSRVAISFSYISLLKSIQPQVLHRDYTGWAELFYTLLVLMQLHQPILKIFCTEYKKESAFLCLCWNIFTQSTYISTSDSIVSWLLAQWIPFFGGKLWTANEESLGHII